MNYIKICVCIEKRFSILYFFLFVPLLFFPSFFLAFLFLVSAIALKMYLASNKFYDMRIVAEEVAKKHFELGSFDKVNDFYFDNFKSKKNRIRHHHWVEKEHLINSKDYSRLCCIIFKERSSSMNASVLIDSKSYHNSILNVINHSQDYFIYYLLDNNVDPKLTGLEKPFSDMPIESAKKRIIDGIKIQKFSLWYDSYYEKFLLPPHGFLSLKGVKAEKFHKKMKELKNKGRVRIYHYPESDYSTYIDDQGFIEICRHIKIPDYDYDLIIKSFENDKKKHAEQKKQEHEMALAYIKERKERKLSTSKLTEGQ